MKKYLLLVLICAGCYSTRNENDAPLVSMQVVDRNGFSETISVKERLAPFQRLDFSQPQPYQKVLRIFDKDENKRSKAILTSYHENGYLWQYLEATSGRANGIYREYYPNGTLRIQAHIIEGMADLHEKAQASWIFDEENTIFDESGHLIAEIFYQKGKLEGISKHYYSSGDIKKILPYHNDELDGEEIHYDIQGNKVAIAAYAKGKREGVSQTYFSPEKLQSDEFFENDFLMKGVYFDARGNKIGQVTNGSGIRCLYQDGYCHTSISYLNGLPDGEVCVYDEKHHLINLYNVHGQKKEGEEWEYYPSGNEQKPKLYLLWHEDRIQLVKTWYENGVLESQKEMNENKRHGMSFAWYQDSSVMYVEEYEKDKLLRGSYYKKGDKQPVSTIEKGKGTAILYDKEGKYYKKIVYENGQPMGELY